MLRYKRIHSVFFTDTLVVQTTPSTRGNPYEQLYVSDKGPIAIYPIH